MKGLVKDDLWVYKLTWKSTTKFTPYELVYGKQSVLPIEFQVPIFRLVVVLGLDLSKAQKERVMQLNELNEII